MHGSGHQPGDPDTAAGAVPSTVAAEQPPTRLPLGTDALRLVQV